MRGYYRPPRGRSINGRPLGRRGADDTARECAPYFRPGAGEGAFVTAQRQDGGPMGGARGIALCKQQAFQNYQQCRGY
ncbi:hypothetical protein PSAC2689_40233 [Paraburkholderia sacchari]